MYQNAVSNPDFEVNLNQSEAAIMLESLNSHSWIGPISDGVYSILFCSEPYYSILEYQLRAYYSSTIHE